MKNYRPKSKYKIGAKNLSRKIEKATYGVMKMENRLYKFEDNYWSSGKCSLVCNLFGDWVTTTSYWHGNHYRIDPNHAFVIATTQEEIDEIRQEEERQSRRARRYRKLLTRKALKAASEHLSDVQYRSFVGYYVEGKTWTQMAREFGCCDKAVKEAVFGNSKGQGGAIRKLRKVLGVTS